MNSAPHTLEDGLMKDEGEMATRPSPWGIFATTSRHTKVVMGVAAVVAAVCVAGGTTALVRSYSRYHKTVQCGERVGQVTVTHDYGDMFPSMYTVRLLSCTKTKSSHAAKILLVDDLWGLDVGHSEGSTARSGPDGTGLVGYGLWTFPDGNVAYHYTYTLGDSYVGNANGDETIHVTFNNGDVMNIEQDTVLLVATQYANNGENNNNGDTNLQIQPVSIDLSQASQSATALQTLVDDNDSIAAFIAQSMANYVEYYQQQSEAAEQEGN